MINLLNHQIVAHIEAAIEQNRGEAASLMHLPNHEIRDRTALLNRTYFELEEARHEAARIPFAPYRIRA